MRNIEKQWYKYKKKYEDKFGKPYVHTIGDNRTDEEIIAEIKECLKTGKPQKLPKPPSSGVLW